MICKNFNNFFLVYGVFNGCIVTINNFNIIHLFVLFRIVCLLQKPSADIFYLFHDNRE